MKRFYLILGALIAMLLVVAAELRRCSAPSPAPLVTPRPESRAKATASTTATASQAVKVTIRRPAHDPHGPKIVPNDPQNQGAGSVLTSDPRFQEEEIVIEVSQTATAAASSEASASVDHIGDVTQMVPQHARLGIALLTAPGILAVDYQLLRLDASPLSRPVLGVDLELGLDVAGNAQVGAVGVTAGGKAFAGAYAWSRWDLGAQGLAGGVGLRF